VECCSTCQTPIQGILKKTLKKDLPVHRVLDRKSHSTGSVKAAQTAEEEKDFVTQYENIY